MANNFKLRSLTPADGPAIAALGEQSPETGAVAFHSEFHYDPYTALLALRPSTIGVAAEAPDHDGLVGLGLVSFGECCYEGALRPYAYFYSLSVHPAYRRRGLATIVVAATVAHALAAGYHEVGWHCSEDNQGSQGVAEKVGFTLTHRFHALGWRFAATG